jgi:hypothetical protein
MDETISILVQILSFDAFCGSNDPNRLHSSGELLGELTMNSLLERIQSDLLPGLQIESLDSHNMEDGVIVEAAKLSPSRS